MSTIRPTISLLQLPSLASLALLAMTACQSPAPTPVPAPEQATAGEAEPKAEAEATPEQAQQGAPKISSDSAVYDFGAVKHADKIEHVFKIRNEGTADLKIDRVQKT